MANKIIRQLCYSFIILCFMAPVTFAKGTIKIGFLAPLSGPAAIAGKSAEAAARLFMDQINSKIAGQQVELIVEDTKAVPTMALQKTKKLVKSSKVDVIIGPVSTASGVAIQPYLESRKVPGVNVMNPIDDFTQRRRPKWSVRVGYNSSQLSHPLGEYAYNVLGYRKVAMLGMDYAYGWEVLGGFQRTFEEAGGKVVQKLWVPPMTTDFSPYIPQLEKDVDAIVVLEAAVMAIRFLKQYNEMGLKKKIPLLGGGTLTDETLMPALGDEALDVVTSLTYSGALDNPANRAFIAAYTKKYGKAPNFYAESYYVGMQAIAQAIESLNGDVSNKKQFMAALKSVDLKNAPRGPLKIDPYGNPIQNIYIRKVERVNGRLQNTVIETFPAVSQFWKYDSEKYLKSPSYSRDYPPVKN